MWGFATATMMFLIYFMEINTMLPWCHFWELIWVLLLNQGNQDQCANKDWTTFENSAKSVVTITIPHFGPSLKWDFVTVSFLFTVNFCDLLNKDS